MDSFRQKILQFLQEERILTSKQVIEVLGLYRREKGRFSSLLTRELIKPEVLSAHIIAHLRIEQAQELEPNIDLVLSNIIPQETASQYSIFPISRDKNQLLLALGDPLAVLDLEDIREFEGYDIRPVIVPKEKIAYFAKKAVSSSIAAPELENVADILNKISDMSVLSPEKTEISDIIQMTQETPVIKATGFIIEKAIQLKASDILIEPLEEVTRIRYRIDGIWYQAERLPKKFHSFLITRIKVISELDIAEHRFPQDGTFKMKLKDDRDVDFRVSIFPCSNGEKAAIRILDKSLGLLDINKLGLKEGAVTNLKTVARLPYGMILACGPTGSGKTTTLYSILKFVNTPEKNVVTVEDPVEYEIKGINQVPVNNKIGINFSRCLRAILRQDPNVIMIGEIRDFETVDIAFKAALTGHLVLSTLHTTTAAGSIIRLVDMGVEPFLINASLIAIISQRLARRICEHCKEKVEGSPYFRGRGCKECFHTGYSGRLLITEILYINSPIREAILSKQIEEKKIKDLAKTAGMKTLREEGLDFAVAGITSLEEVLRVTPADE